MTTLIIAALVALMVIVIPAIVYWAERRDDHDVFDHGEDQ